MLDPEGRHLLLDALRPPPGTELDIAVGTTYTLDLHALLMAPIAFAMFDREREDGSTRIDPIATLQALRRHAKRITIFCQAGDIAVPAEYRSLVVYLEGSVYPVTPPDSDAIFHPKVWLIRFRSLTDGDAAYRLLCLTRNLTFDRSWDTVLRLEGSLTDAHRHPELGEFVAALPRLADPVKPIAGDRRVQIEELAAEASRIEWQLPGHMRLERFWPIGHDGRPAWPFLDRMDRTLVISPFITAGTLDRLLRPHRRRDATVLSRPETLDRLGTNALVRCGESLVLTADAATSDDGTAAPPEAASTTTTLTGLHAKLVVADVPYGARIWTGSANMTDAAFSGNVEFLVELRGRKQDHGVHATIGEAAHGIGLRKLTEPYTPGTPGGRPLTDQEALEQRLARARRVIGRLRFTATCKAQDGRYELALTGTPSVGRDVDEGILEGLEATARPVTLGDVAATPFSLARSGFTVRNSVSYEAITPFFAIRLGTGPLLETTFLVNAELIGAPDDRTERVMTGLLRDRAALIRFLLLLLGNVEHAMAGFVEDSAGTWSGTGSWPAALRSDALLEPLLRAYARDPDRLEDIRAVVAELARAEGGRDVLPAGWDAVWGPIDAALDRQRP